MLSLTLGSELMAPSLSRSPNSNCVDLLSTRLKSPSTHQEWSASDGSVIVVVLATCGVFWAAAPDPACNKNQTIADEHLELFNSYHGLYDLILGGYLVKQLFVERVLLLLLLDVEVKQLVFVQLRGRQRGWVSLGSFLGLGDLVRNDFTQVEGQVVQAHILVLAVRSVVQLLGHGVIEGHV